MKRFINPALFAILLIALACSSDKPLPSGYDTLPRENKGEVLIYEAPLLQAARFRAPVIAGTAPYLVLGEYRGIQSRVALMFSNLAAFDTATVLSAELALNQVGFFGSGAAMNGTIHPINTTWTETTVRWEDLRGQFDMARSFPYSTTAVDSGVIRAAIDPALVNDWKKGSGNNGLLLDYQPSGFAVKIPSTDYVGGWATLRIIYAPKAGGLDTVTVSADRDASLFTDDDATPVFTLSDAAGDLALDNGAGYRFLLRFDLSALPAEAAVHRGLLSMTVRSENSETDSTGLSLSVRQVVSDSAWQNLSAMKLDSLYSSPTADVTDDGLIFQISSSPSVSYMGAIAQRWILKQQPNLGVLVQSNQYGQDLERVHFFNAADPTRKPTLRITYSLPPSARF